MPLFNDLSDLELVDKICFEKKSDKEIKLIFQRVQKAMMNDIIYHANKLGKRTSNFSDGWIYKVNDVIPVLVTDAVAEAYLWLSERIKKKICNYTGDADANLRTFLNTDMSKPWTRSDWLSWYYKRYTQYGITNKGDVGYIPTCIKKLSKTHQQVFLLLRRHKSEEKLVDETELGLEQIQLIIDSLRTNLIKAGKIELITNISSGTLDDLYTSEENEQAFSEIYELFKRHFDNLEKIEKELLKLKYYMGYTVKEIISFYENSGRINELKDFGLSTERSLYDYIGKLVSNIAIALSVNEVADEKEAVIVLMKKLFEG
jgi:hypothetical protein